LQKYSAAHPAFGRDEVSSRRWRDGHADSYVEPLSSCVNIELVYVEARSQGVVGEGSTAEELDQGPEGRLDRRRSHRAHLRMR
jgi:hypothetical protein